MSFADVRAAVDETYACLDDAGIGYIEGPRDPDKPYAAILFSVEIEDPALEVVADACVNGRSYWLQSAYEQQPAGQEASDLEFERARPLLIQCLLDHGLAADESLTNAELKEMLIYSETGIDRTSGSEVPDNWDSMGCLDAGGLDGF